MKIKSRVTLKKRCVLLLLVTIFLAVLISTARAESYSMEQQRIVYETGLNAYRQGDCLNAVTYLTAYQYIASPQLRNPGFNNEIHAAVNYCRTEIQHALQIKEQLKGQGSIVNITVDVSGKASGQPQLVTYPFTMPANPNAYKGKPGLPGSPR